MSRKLKKETMHDEDLVPDRRRVRNAGWGSRVPGAHPACRALTPHRLLHQQRRRKPAPRRASPVPSRQRTSPLNSGLRHGGVRNGYLIEGGFSRALGWLERGAGSINKHWCPASQARCHCICASSTSYQQAQINTTISRWRSSRLPLRSSSAAPRRPLSGLTATTPRTGTVSGSASLPRCGLTTARSSTSSGRPCRPRSSSP